MGKRRNRKKKANKQMDPQQHSNDFSSDGKIQENCKNLSQNEKTDDKYNEKASHSTFQNEAAISTGPVVCETLHSVENVGGSRSTFASCTGSGGFKSTNRFPSRSGDGSLIEEPQCVSFHENKFKSSHGRLSATPEYWSNTSRNHLGSYTYERYPPNPAGNPKKCFEEALNRWLPIRNKSIRKLQQLLDKVSEDEASFDNLELNLKYGSEFCKRGKVQSTPSSPWESVCSFGSLFFDLAGGLSSISHMVNTDTIQKEFQETMDEDADATKKMHEARSKYITEYQYTEEIIRKFGGTTLRETLEKVSETVGITEFFRKMEKAKNNNEDIVLAAITALDTIITRNCNRDVGREVADAVQELVDTNPACVGAAAGVGKSLYGVAGLHVKTRTTNDMSGALVRAGTGCFDVALMRQEQSDIRELERKIEDGSKTTIGKRIQEALDMFEEEKNEMLELLRKL